MKETIKKLYAKVPSGVICLIIIFGLFFYMGSIMGLAPMLNTMMHTAHELLLNTCFYLMAVCVITGAIAKLFIEFGVVDLLEKLLRPLMRPLYNLPGVASLGAVLTFMSDNPAIMTLSKDKRFASYFKKYQFISLTNFSTSFGMGLIVMIFMIGYGYLAAPVIGFMGAIVGGIFSTRLMQRFILRTYPHFAHEEALKKTKVKAIVAEIDEDDAPSDEPRGTFIRTLNALLDGGRSGVDIGLAIIPGVLVISCLVMMLTFGPDAASNSYTGGAFQGTQLLPSVAGHFSVVFDWLFGLSDPHQIAFPITALGAVSAALGLIPNFIAHGWVDGNAVAVFTAIGMCWSGFLSTYTAMFDSLGYRELTSKAIIAQTLGGLLAATTAHWFYVLFTLVYELLA